MATLTTTGNLSLTAPPGRRRGRAARPAGDLANSSSGSRRPTDAVFYLGVPRPQWLERTPVPLFVSDATLRHRRSLPRARGRWCLDSGGYSQLSRHGTWSVDPRSYVERVYRYREEIGGLQWCAPQDWVCEPWVVHGGYHDRRYFVGTGLSVLEHQHRTISNYLRLRLLAPDLPFIPVLQGWTVEDYLRAAVLYEREGVDLAAAPAVGVGSVCRRQGTAEAAEIIEAVAGLGLTNLHGLGFKTTGLRRVGALLASADSMAWSYAARRGARHPHHDHPCNNCLPWALWWRQHRALPALQASADEPGLPPTAR